MHGQIYHLKCIDINNSISTVQYLTVKLMHKKKKKKIHSNTMPYHFVICDHHWSVKRLRIDTFKVWINLFLSCLTSRDWRYVSNKNGKLFWFQFHFMIHESISSQSRDMLISLPQQVICDKWNPISGYQKCPQARTPRLPFTMKHRKLNSE